MENLLRSNLSKRLRNYGILLAISAGLVAACANGSSSGSPFANSGSGGSASNGSSGGGSGGDNGGNSGTTSGGFASGSGTSSGSGMHTQVCTDAGCSCITIASLGYEGVWGPCASDTTTAFQDWLNSKSTAHVDTFNQHASIPNGGMITTQWLSQYNVIILQWMVDSLNVAKNTMGATTGVTEGTPWQLSTAEIQAIQTWVQGGGGIIVLTGYNCEGGNNANCGSSKVVDNIATNQILSAFTHMTVNSDDTFNAENGFCAAENCYCWGASVPLGAATAAIASPLTRTAATSMGLVAGTWNNTPISAGVTDVGAFNGRSINVTDMTKVTIDAANGGTILAAHEDIGAGHVFVYGDEWITYTGEWTGNLACTSAYNYDSGSCAGKSAADVFQIPVFWYNSIKYASSSAQCFMIQGVL